ncbi:DMT family transporter, partial [Candidatus Aminicenantes bacterium AH-873-B07]|nr:DMT family transporter [Candidatus Aminicenantes bacterium AH-873-B07]
IYVDPPSGVNQISNVVSNISNGDVVILDQGVYTQTVPIIIPSGVTQFGIIGRGINLTKINFQGCDGIKQSNTVQNIRQAYLQGLTMTTDRSGTHNGITLRGQWSNIEIGSTIVIKDILLKGVSSNDYWGIGIKAHYWWNFLIDHCFINGSSFSGKGIQFLSCVNGDIVGGEYRNLQRGFELTKSPDYSHGCEGIGFTITLVISCNYRAYIDTASLHISFNDAMFDYMKTSGIYETTNSIGQHSIKGGWIAFRDDATPGEHGIILRKDGSIVSNLQPVFAIIFAFIILKEKISFFQLIGAIIIFTGVYLTRWGDKLFLRSKIKKLLIKILP